MQPSWTVAPGLRRLVLLARRLTLLGLVAVVCSCDFGSSPSSVPYREVLYETAGGFSGAAARAEIWSDGRVVLSGLGFLPGERVFSPNELQPLRAIMHGEEFRALAPTYYEPNPYDFLLRIRVTQERGVQAVDVYGFVERPAVLDRAMAEVRAVVAAVPVG